MAKSASELAAGLRAGFAAYARGDYDAVVATFHPEIEIVPLGGQSPIRGVQAVREWLEPQAFAEQTSEILELRVEGRKALTRLHTRARGSMSGIEIEFGWWGVWTYDEEGLLLRWEMYPVEARAEAFAAADMTAPE